MTRSSVIKDDKVLVGSERLDAVLARKPETTSIMFNELVATDASIKNTHNSAGHSSIVTHGTKQFISYYDTDGFVVLGERVISSSKGGWTLNKLNSGNTKQLADFEDNHDTLQIGFDEQSFCHVSGMTHGEALVYWRMPTANTIVGAASANLAMVGTNETLFTYPNFFNDSNGILFVHFRDGATAADNDRYMYRYTVSGGWVAAPGTSTAGLFVLLSDVNKGSYVGKPYVDSNDVAHFDGNLLDSGNQVKPFYFAYNMSTGAFTQASGSGQTIPMLEANLDLIENITTDKSLVLNLGNWRPYVNSSGHIYVTLSFDDAAGIKQVYLYKYSGASWSNVQVTNHSVNPNANIGSSVPALLVNPNNTSRWYIFDWNPSSTFCQMVYESKDSGLTWEEPYPILEPSWHRFSFGIDWESWDATGVFYRLFDFSADIDNGSNAALGSRLGGKRELYIQNWIPGEGKTLGVNDFTQLMSDNDVNIRSFSGSVNVPIIGNINNPGLTTTVFKVSTGSSGIRVNEAGDGEIFLGNLSGTTSEFQPGITCESEGSARDTRITAQVDPTDDTGSSPVMIIRARQNDSTDLTTRPAISLRNNNTDLMTLDFDGTVAVPSITGAFIPNILTTTQRDALTPTDGMLCYNSTTSKLNVYTGAAWEVVTSA